LRFLSILKWNVQQSQFSRTNQAKPVKNTIFLAVMWDKYTINHNIYNLNLMI
jgi:hypothetical protein